MSKNLDLACVEKIQEVFKIIGKNEKNLRDKKWFETWKEVRHYLASLRDEIKEPYKEKDEEPDCFVG